MPEEPLSVQELPEMPEEQFEDTDQSEPDPELEIAPRDRRSRIRMTSLSAHCASKLETEH